MATIHPNLKLAGQFSDCEAATAKINKNFKTLDDVVLKGVDGIVSALPSSPVEGQAVVLDTDNSLNVYSGGVWTSYAPNVGWNFIDVTDYGMIIFDGTQWNKIPLPNDYTNFMTDMGNIGNGEGVFNVVNGTVAELRSLLAGNGITIQSSLSGEEIEIINDGVLGANNVGSGVGIFKGFDFNQGLEFKTLTVGPGLSLTDTADEVNISLAGQALPVNWWPDPLSLDNTQLLFPVSGNDIVATIENDDIFYNTEKLYSAVGKDFPPNNNTQTVRLEVQKPVNLLTLADDPDIRGYIDIDLDVSDLPDSQSGGFGLEVRTATTATVRQLDSSNNILTEYNATNLLNDMFSRAFNLANISDTSSLRVYFKPHANLDKIQIDFKVEYQST